MPEHPKPCFLIIDYDVSTPPSSKEIATLIEKGTEEEKIDAMKTLILMILQDENFPRMIMTVVQHAMRSESKYIKKLLLIYWEVIEKTNPDGTLKDEMVMLCNALRNDLLSPNEFVRARTLRLVAKMRYRDLMDSLLQPVLECLNHRHPYVRRNAVMCVYSIYMTFGDDMFPDAVDRIDDLLANESDLSTKRNCLLFLFEAAPSVAMKYLNSVLLDEEDSSSLFGSSADILQLVVLDELKKVCKANPLEKGRYMKSIFTLSATSKSQSVLFECASTIVQLTSLASAVKLAISTYIKLLNDPSADNNVKLLALERLVALRPKYSNILREQSIDIIRSLSSPSNDIRKKCLDLCLDLLSSKNVEDIVKYIKKELIGVQGKKEELAYQEILIEGLHKCAVRFPEVTGSLGLVEVLIDCCLLQASTSGEVAAFLQHLMNNYPQLASNIYDKLHYIFSEIKTSTVYRTVMWMMAEHSEDPKRSINCILSAVGERPFINKRERAQQTENQTEEQNVHRTVILPDGTYGTQIISSTELKKPTHVTGLRKLLTEVEEVDFYLVTVLAVTLTKLYFKLENSQQDKCLKEILLVLTGLVQLRTYPKKSKTENSYSEVAFSIDPDNFERIVHCIQTLTGLVDSDWLEGGKDLYKLCDDYSYKHEETENEQGFTSQPDDLIAVKQLRGREGINDIDFTEDEAFKALFSEIENDSEASLKRVKQLTGLGDPVYVECSMKLNHYDIVLEFNIFNRTSETLQNLTLELSCQGDIKIVEKPQSCNIGAAKSITLKGTVKVSSTQAGSIFGNITYDVHRAGMKVLSLNEINIDPIEYIVPESCTDSEFRKLWQELKWESQVPVKHNKADLKNFVNYLAQQAHMQIVTPESVMNCSSQFLVCNLYAKSRFAEDALINVSVELGPGGLCGTTRIRAKSEGMAKCLGERVNLIQQQYN